MNSKIEFKTHNDNLISMRDMEGDIDIANSKWDTLFSKCSDVSENIYFKGVRAYYESEKINALLKNYSNSIISDISFAEITPSRFLISRKGFSNLWQHYEYPFLFFVGKGVQDKNFEQIFINGWVIEDVMKSLTSSLVIYRSFEQDVIWMMKTNDLIFPDLI